MPSPLEKIPHVPGQSLDDMIIDEILSRTSFYAGIIGICLGIIVYVWISYLLGVSPDPIPATIFLGSLIVYLFYKLRQSKQHLLHLKQGREGEREVGYILENFRKDGARVVHDIVGDNFNVDHAVVSLKGIFTVETKTWTKNTKTQR